LSHGACYVESNMGSSQIFGTETDPTIFYRSNAATAEYCRTLARELYGTKRAVGIVFGGSGGGYKTMSCIENTNAYDGAVPYVIGSPMSLPNCLAIGALSKRMLRDCWPRVVDACEPGGSGDIYAGLNEEERAALREMVLMGVPPRVIAGFDTDDDGSLPVLTPGVHAMDPDYFTDFWTVPGYEGTIEGGSAQRDRICIHTRVVTAGFLDGNSSQEAHAADGAEEEISDGETDGRSGMNNHSGDDRNGTNDHNGTDDRSGTNDHNGTDDCSGTDDRNGTDDAWQKMMTDIRGIYIQTEDLRIAPDAYLKGVDIIFETGAAAGKKLRLDRIEGDKIIPGVSYGMDDFQDVFSRVKPGDQISLDNSDYIAIQYYHRHQVPEDLSFHAWDQYRDSNGKPLCPQQKQVIAYGFTAGGCGSVQDACDGYTHLRNLCRARVIVE
ncbi:MAG: hypothetical protein LUE87_06555, partial [Lachnospiraceae bacterium]|nr:hypothetical protein [Lachnospiraceae bacterium]